MYLKKHYPSFIVFLLLAGLLVWTAFNSDKEFSIENGLVLLGVVKTQISMEQKINEGIELLSASPVLEGDLSNKQIALAILNKKTGEVFEKRVWVTDQDIEYYRRTGILVPEHEQPGDDLNVEVQWWNSFNSYFIFPDNPEFVVVANKYMLPSSYLAGLPEQSGGQYTDIIYSPYSKDLHLPEIIEKGKKYLEERVDKAFEQLEARKVFSRSSPGSIITATVDPDFIKNIILVEHIDPQGFIISTDGGKELTERVLTVIGANQERAYRYTGSPAGASGMAQFIRPTYDSMVIRYPEAKLIKDYNMGMADHTNAIKAMVLFFDLHKKDISNKVTRQDIIRQIGITEEMLAAAYNGGPGRVVRSVNEYGMAWVSSQLNLSKTTVFRKETLNYIKKFQSIKGLRIF